MSGKSESVLRSAAALALVAAAGTALLAGVYRLTADRIAEQERRVVLEQLGEIIPPSRYNNELQEDRLQFSDAGHFPGNPHVTAFRARKDGRPVAVILRFTAPDGYNGPIQLLAGIDYDGSLAGVRVVAHRETPGLGDAIEAEKSDWIRGFEGRSLGDPAPERWSVKRDGGAFDQFTGATITPRAIVEAVQRALEYYDSHREAVFAPGPDSMQRGEE